MCDSQSTVGAEAVKRVRITAALCCSNRRGGGNQQRRRRPQRLQLTRSKLLQFSDYFQPCDTIDCMATLASTARGAKWNTPQKSNSEHYFAWICAQKNVTCEWTQVKTLPAKRLRKKLSIEPVYTQHPLSSHFRLEAWTTAPPPTSPGGAFNHRSMLFPPQKHLSTAQQTQFLTPTAE